MQCPQGEVNLRMLTMYSWFWVTLSTVLLDAENVQLTKPRQVPLVTPRLSSFGGVPGNGPFQLFTVTCGRPPANSEVVAILRVRAPIWLGDSWKNIGTGPISLNIAMGKSPIGWPTV